MPKSTTHPDPIVFLKTVAKFLNAMAKVGAPLDHFTSLIECVASRRNLAEYFTLGCPKVDANGVVDTKPTAYDLARHILVDDFITAEEIMKVRKVVYTDEQLETLYDSLPSMDAIISYRANNFFLLPNPSVAMSLINVLVLKEKLFHFEEKFYAQHVFAIEDKTEVATWIAVCKEIIPNSQIDKLKERRKLVFGIEQIPNVAEIAWALTTYKEVRGTYPMKMSSFGRTSSISSGIGHVIVAAFADLGIVADDFLNEELGVDVGVFSKRKCAT